MVDVGRPAARNHVFAAVWLLTLDVYVAERTTDGEQAFCGSAFDVVLFKQGFGRTGETPPNVAAIDKACLAEGRRDVVLGTLTGVVGLSAAGYAAMRADRTGSRRRATLASTG